MKETMIGNCKTKQNM